MNEEIHGLRKNLPLREFVKGPPGTWPDGHGQVDYRKVRQITCRACLPIARKLEVEEKRASKNSPVGGLEIE